MTDQPGPDQGPVAVDAVDGWVVLSVRGEVDLALEPALVAAHDQQAGPPGQSASARLTRTPNHAADGDRPQQPHAGQESPDLGAASPAGSATTVAGSGARVARMRSQTAGGRLAGGFNGLTGDVPQSRRRREDRGVVGAEPSLGMAGTHPGRPTRWTPLRSSWRCWRPSGSSGSAYWAWLSLAMDPRGQRSVGRR